MSARLPGKSLIAFGVTTILSSLIAMYFLDAFTLDLLAIAVVPLGASVRDGNRTAAKWATGIMVYYALVGIFLLIAAVVEPDWVRIGARPIRPEQLPWALGIGGTVAAWAAVNASMLAILLRQPRHGGEEERSVRPADWQGRPLNPLRARLGFVAVTVGAVLIGLGLFLHPSLFTAGTVLAVLGLVLRPPGTWGVR